MHLAAIGLSHRTAPIEVRERLAIPEAALLKALGDLASRDRISECVLLSTCNRTEIYAWTPAKADAAVIIDWMCEFSSVPLEQLETRLYSYSGHKTAEHLFRVAAGIDSMVVGEAQILSQVKASYAAASRVGTTGRALNSLFQQAINVGKRARAETDIGRGAFSVGSVAAQLARSIFDDLKRRVVLVIGAGKMAELTVTHLTSSGASKVLVANRTREKAMKLAEQFGGCAVEYEALRPALNSADIVITATGSAEPIITRKMAATVMRERRGRPLFLIDIALPRDVEPAVGTLDGVFLYDIDDFQAAVESSAVERRLEVAKVEEIIAEEVREFKMRMRTVDAVPVISALREKFEGVRQQELEKLSKRLGHLSPGDLELIDVTTRSIVNKICHTPMTKIKDYAASDDAPARLDSICDLFGIRPVDDEGKREASRESGCG